MLVVSGCQGVARVVTRVAKSNKTNIVKNVT